MGIGQLSPQLEKQSAAPFSGAGVGVSTYRGPSGAKRGKPVDAEPEYVVDTPAQYLLICPDRYLDYKNLVERLHHDHLNEPVCVSATVKVMKFYGAKGELAGNQAKFAKRVFLVCVDAGGMEFSCAVFGKVGWRFRDVKVGGKVALSGTLAPDQNGRLQLEDANLIDADEQGSIVSIFPKLGKVAGAKLKTAMTKVYSPELIDQAAALVQCSIDGGWTEALAKRVGFATPQDLIKAMHFPESIEQAQLARDAAKLLSAHSLIGMAKHQLKKAAPVPKSMWSISREDLNALSKRMKFKLSTCQVSAIKGISSELAAPHPMNAMLCGDVGTGKTLTFLFPALIGATKGKQVIVVVPNTLLVEQIAAEAKDLAPHVNVTMVSGNGIIGPHDLSSGGLVVGTTAICSAIRRGDLVVTPDLLVVDEQQRFSVEQREQLLAPHTNFLESTATPIPRTVALLLHAGKTVFRLETCPVVKTIDTSVVRGAEKTQVLLKIANKVLAGEQCAVIYPLVEENEEIEAKSIAEVVEKWKKIIPAEKIAVLHGKLSSEEKTRIISDFKAKRFDFLISSTVIEVGVTVPSLKTLAVVNAERYGVVALHQLRGRLARHGGHGEFFLCAGDKAGRDALTRLGLLVKHTNGFKLAEADAENRGYGDILGDGDQKGKTRYLFQGVPIMPNDIAEAQNLLNAPVVATEEKQAELEI